MQIFENFLLGFPFHVILQNFRWNGLDLEKNSTIFSVLIVLVLESSGIFV